MNKTTPSITIQDAECRYAECHYAECHNAECHYAECHYAEYCYTGCHKKSIMMKIFRLSVIMLSLSTPNNTPVKCLLAKCFLTERQGAKKICDDWSYLHPQFPTEASMAKTFGDLEKKWKNVFCFFSFKTSGLYYKRVTIVIDAPSVVSK